MTETEQTKPGEGALAGDEAAIEAEPRQSSEEAECEEAIEQLAGSSAEIARLEAEKADLTDRLLRLAADMDNLRRRTERDVTDARKYAVSKFAMDMLAVGDNLKRALEAVPAEQRQSGDEWVRALIEGVEVTAREMERLLEKHGITRIAAKGERFDPNRHQAMFEVPDASVPAGTIVEVMQEGYQIGDRVLRAALVGVAKGVGVGAEAASAEAGK
ncbi:MAG TPA: nucleotide exchange factor GrpE [Propylenella sp.]|nr:nucleotide exchange factor GrpE [Propylenella sp.]